MHDIGPKAGNVTRTAEMEVAGGDGPPWLEITAENFLVLYSCLQDISHDAGFGANHSTFSISARWEPELPRIEATLAGLSDEDRRLFCIGDGDGDGAARIADRSPELGLVDELFEDFAES